MLVASALLDRQCSSRRLLVTLSVLTATALTFPVAAEAALTYMQTHTSSRLGGLVMLNGWLLPGVRRSIRDGAATGLRVLLSHGSADEQVGFDCAEAAAKLLREGGAELTVKVQQGADHAHSGFGAGKDAACHFLTTLLRGAGGGNSTATAQQLQHNRSGDRSADLDGTSTSSNKKRRRGKHN